MHMELKNCKRQDANSLKNFLNKNEDLEASNFHLILLVLLSHHLNCDLHIGHDFGQRIILWVQTCPGLKLD